MMSCACSRRDPAVRLGTRLESREAESDAHSHTSEVETVMEKRPGLTDLSAADEGAAISLEPTREQIPQLRMLLSAGAFVRVVTGHSLRELICEQFRVSPDYLERDIKVLFLNYSPVNDMDSAIIKDEAILALCGAMPGLVGAAMRRDGLSSMRSSITYKKEATERVQGEG